MTQWLAAKEQVESLWTLASKDASFCPDQSARAVLEEVFQQLDQGVWRVASPEKSDWTVHTWIKKAIILAFRFNGSRLIDGGAQTFFDKIPLKTTLWAKETFEVQGFRMVVGAVVRRSAYIGAGAVIMPCFINVAAYVGAQSMIESMSSVGSCAQIGERCHISEGVCLGGMLEPIMAHPVIVEEGCFIGARCSITEGVKIERGSILGPGVHLNASTKIYNVATGEITFGRIPAYSVVLNGSLPDPRGFNTHAAIITKTLDESTRDKIPVVDVLRDL